MDKQLNQRGNEEMHLFVYLNIYFRLRFYFKSRAKRNQIKAFIPQSLIIKKSFFIKNNYNVWTIFVL